MFNWNINFRILFHDNYLPHVIITVRITLLICTKQVWNWKCYFTTKILNRWLANIWSNQYTIFSQNISRSYKTVTIICHIRRMKKLKTVIFICRFLHTFPVIFGTPPLKSNPFAKRHLYLSFTFIAHLRYMFMTKLSFGQHMAM